jgi:hypothetical protein
VKVAVIADAGRVQKFLRDCLDAVEGCEEVTVFSCTNTRTSKKPIRHGAYYALNLLAVRNAWTRPVPVAGTVKRIVEEVRFESGYEGAWQVLPEAVVARLAEFDIILKFGMGLTRVPPEEVLPVPILSYHHGDPDRYRGRPAGFWEMAAGEPLMGQIVQAIGNRLDAGRVLAFGETKVHAHSYRRTLIEAYRHSPLLMNAAIRNALSGVALDKPCTGRNYRLPGNWTVARVVAAMALRALRRLAYGTLFEKRWLVSQAPAPAEPVAAIARAELVPPPETWRSLEAAPGYTFYADPFFSDDPPGLLVEALRARTGLGEIVLVDDSGHRRISPEGGHFSYPATIRSEGRQLVLPETASWAPPTLHGFAQGALAPVATLDLEPPQLVSDPTLLEHEGRFYLFGNVRGVGSGALFLWSAEDLRGKFTLHPAAPILVSPKGARMGGAFLRAEGRLIRFGQDFRFGYGDGLFAFDVETLTPERYSERCLGAVRFADRHGPHTMNLRRGELLFDWYRDAFSPLAGARRLANRLDARRRARRSGEAPPAQATDPRR